MIIFSVLFSSIIQRSGLADLKGHQIYIRDLCVFCNKDWVVTVNEVLDPKNLNLKF